MSVTFTLGPREGALRETVVDGDAGSGAKVALIDVRGVILDTARPGLLSGGTSAVDEVVSRLKKAERDPAVKAVVLRINSPGGSVTASDTVYEEVRRFREASGKPVVASLGEVAASGGYYVALAADEVVAQPTSITGSIGVIMPTINVSEGMKKIGIVSRSVKSGPNKDLANPMEPMRDSQYALLQGMVDEFYGRFRGLVVERRGSEGGAAASGRGRRLAAERVDELTDGRVVTGAEAVRAGLADREGNLREAFGRAMALAGVPRARLVKYHSEGESPRSPYAAEARAPGGEGAAGAVDVSLLRVDLGGGGWEWLPPGQAYYVWSVGVW
jgi:protease-4